MSDEQAKVATTTCRTRWGVAHGNYHSCHLPSGHPGLHECDACDSTQEIPDLMAALEHSVQQARDARRSGSGGAA